METLYSLVGGTLTGLPVYWLYPFVGEPPTDETPVEIQSSDEY